MRLNAKIDLVRSIIDELATMQYDIAVNYSSPHYTDLKELIKSIPLAHNQTKANTTINALKMLANTNQKDFKGCLLGLNTLSEKALSELHNQQPNKKGK